MTRPNCEKKQQRQKKGTFIASKKGGADDNKTHKRKNWKRRSEAAEVDSQAARLQVAQCEDRRRKKKNRC
jgi:hypothetical protein